MQLDQVPIQFVPGELPSTAPLAPPPPPPAPTGIAATMAQVQPMTWLLIGAGLLLLWPMLTGRRR